MGKWYFTFGCGQPHEGHVIPVVAPSAEAARAHMISLYGVRWCGQYEEQHWKDWVKKARECGIPIEREMNTLTATAEVEVDEMECEQ